MIVKRMMPMRYELYVDSLIWINFWMNLYLLILTNVSTLRTATPRRLCMGAALGALGFIVPIGLTHSLIGMIVGIALVFAGMLMFAFRVRRWKTFVRLLEQMLFYSFCMGGCLLFLKNLTPAWAKILDSPLGLPTVGGVLFLLLYKIKVAGCYRNCICVATLKTGNVTLEIPALIDSGNNLVEPISGKPVCVIDKEVFEGLWKDNPPGFRVIPYHSVGRNRGILSGYLLEELEIDYEGILLKFQKVYLAVSQEDISNGCGAQSIKIIINPGLFQEKRNGRPSRRQNERRNDFKSGNAGKNAV